MKIKSNERVCVCGKTGSGKSHLVRQLLSCFNRVIFFDPKRENFDLKGDVVYNLDDVKEKIKQPNFFIIYAPLSLNDAEFDEFCKLVYYEGNLTLILDEVISLGSHKVNEWHNRLIRLGRSRGIGIWHLIQRPSFVSNYILSESEHFFLFKLQTEQDRKKIKGIIGDCAELLNDLPQYHFVYYNHLEEARACPPV